MQSAADLKIKLFADGADKATMLEMYRNPLIQGFTTNPTLMRKAGIADYASFARDIVQAIPDRPISFEVFADDFREMERQARIIAAWGPNVNAKIPDHQHERGAVFRLGPQTYPGGNQAQYHRSADLGPGALRGILLCGEERPPLCRSSRAVSPIPARDPIPVMSAALEEIADLPDVELIWASPRELLNVDPGGCDRLSHHHRHQRHSEKAVDRWAKTWLSSL